MTIDACTGVIRKINDPTICAGHFPIYSFVSEKKGGFVRLLAGLGEFVGLLAAKLGKLIIFSFFDLFGRRKRLDRGF